MDVPLFIIIAHTFSTQNDWKIPKNSVWNIFVVRPFLNDKMGKGAKTERPARAGQYLSTDNVQIKIVWKGNQTQTEINPMNLNKKTNTFSFVLRLCSGNNSTTFYLVKIVLLKFIGNFDSNWGTYSGFGDVWVNVSFVKYGEWIIFCFVSVASCICSDRKLLIIMSEIHSNMLFILLW